MGRGEAVVVFVIKLLEDAIRDGDKIYATVSFIYSIWVHTHVPFST
jgi:acyl transferase domain-containing protein